VTVLPIIATVACAIACGVLVAAEAKRSRVRFVAKPIASLAFVAVPLVGNAIAGGDDAVRWIAIGLVLGAIGDVLLLWERAFLGGLVAFLLGHVAYVVAFATWVPPADWIAGATIAGVALPIVAGGAALAWLWRHLGKTERGPAMHGPVIAYVAVITAMVIGAAAVAGAGDLPLDARRLVLAGALLFFASDLAVARDKFVAAGFVNRAWGLPAYYAAQLLIAWSTIAAIA
jgi:uncharacterized membrane protein YhhN